MVYTGRSTAVLAGPGRVRTTSFGTTGSARVVERRTGRPQPARAPRAKSNANCLMPPLRPKFAEGEIPTGRYFFGARHGLFCGAWDPRPARC
jgi:hypothetical protein